MNINALIEKHTLEWNSGYRPHVQRDMRQFAIELLEMVKKETDSLDPLKDCVGWVIDEALTELKE
jgi:hypothetical protein